VKSFHVKVVRNRRIQSGRLTQFCNFDLNSVAIMKHTIIIVLLLFTGLTSTVRSESPRQAFVKAWKGQSVVIKTTLYSLVYNERGMLGNTRSGRREGLLVVTSSRGGHLQFDGRQGRDTVVAKEPAQLVKAVFAAYEANALEPRPYRRLEPLAVEQFVPGAELVVRDVYIERDEVKLEFEQADGSKDTTTSLRVKWPLPLSPSFSERRHLEDLLRRFVEIRQP